MNWQKGRNIGFLIEKLIKLIYITKSTEIVSKFELVQEINKPNLNITMRSDLSLSSTWVWYQSKWTKLEHLITQLGSARL